MADIWNNEPLPPLVPIGEVEFGLDRSDEFEITDAENDLCVVPLTMHPLSPEQKKAVQFLDLLDWRGLTIDRRRTCYERCLRSAVKKSSSRK